MDQLINNFYFDESGAVTVDWVVLTAAVIGLGGAVTLSVGEGTMDLANLVSSGLADTILTTYQQFGIDYEPTSPYHGQFWQGDTPWAEITYEAWSEKGDVELLAEYANYYDIATTNGTKWVDIEYNIDFLAVSEQIMADRGIDRPDGNYDAAGVKANYLFF